MLRMIVPGMLLVMAKHIQIDLKRLILPWVRIRCFMQTADSMAVVGEIQLDQISQLKTHPINYTRMEEQPAVKKRRSRKR